MQDVDVNTPTCDGGLPVRVVMFDMAGVLVNDIVGPLRELAITKCSIQNERADELRRFWRKTWNEFKVTPGKTEKEFYERLHAEFPETRAMSTEDLSRHIHEMLDKCGFQDVINLAEKVRDWSARQPPEKRVLLGILSNHVHEWFNSLVENWCGAVLLKQRYNLRTIFREPSLIMPSCTVRCAKPDPAIFEELKKRAKALVPNIHDDQIVIIDDKEPNVQAARKAGIRAILHNSRKAPVAKLIEALAEVLRCDVQCLLS